MGSDGVLTLKLVASNSDEEGAARLLHGLWQDYRQHSPDRSGTWKGRKCKGHTEVRREKSQVQIIIITKGTSPENISNF